MAWSFGIFKTMENNKRIEPISGRFRYVKINEDWHKLEMNFPPNLVPYEKDPFGTIAIEIYDPNFIHRVLVYINFAENVKEFNFRHIDTAEAYALMDLYFYHIPEVISFFITKEEYHLLFDYTNKFFKNYLYIVPDKHDSTLKGINYD